MAKHPLAGTSTTGGELSVFLQLGGFNYPCAGCGLQSRMLTLRDGRYYCKGCSS